MAKFNQKYDWGTWFARTVLYLRKGRDYECDTVAMAQQVRNEAVKRRLKVRISETAAGLRVVVLLPDGRGVKCQS